MSLQAALLICGVVVLALISWFSFEKHRLQRINERARNLHGAGGAVDGDGQMHPGDGDAAEHVTGDRRLELTSDDVARRDGQLGGYEGRYEDGRPGGRGLRSLLRRHDKDVKTVSSQGDGSGDALGEGLVDGMGDGLTDPETDRLSDASNDVASDEAQPVLRADSSEIDDRSDHSLSRPEGSLAADAQLSDSVDMDSRVDADADTVTDSKTGSEVDADASTHTDSIKDQYAEIQRSRGRDADDIDASEPVSTNELSPTMQSELDDAEQITQQRVTPAFKMEEVDVKNEIDFISHLLDFPKPVGRDRALSFYRQVEYLLDKPHRIIGLSHPHRTWVDLEEEPETGQYTELVLTLQLANQDGPINDSQLNKFSDLTVQICEASGGRFQFSTSFEQATERAQQLDEFCKRYDVLAVLNVVAKGDGLFTGEAIEQFARDHDMQLGKMKIYHRDNTGPIGGQHLFSLANLYRPGTFDGEDMRRFSTSGLTIFMNVPTTTDPGRIFREMALVGRALRDRFDANLVDQNKQTLTDQGIQNIQTEVDRLAAQMRKEGITAGSESAVRLF